LRDNNSPVAGSRASAEHEAKFSDEDFVVVVQYRGIDRASVDVSSAEAACVDYPNGLAQSMELCVTPAHADIVEKDVAFEMPARRRDSSIEKISSSSIRTAFDDKKRGAVRSFRDSACVGIDLT
jgi:hypothetical protein